MFSTISVTNEVAALAQVREQELGLMQDEGSSSLPSVSELPQVLTSAVKSKTTNSTCAVPQREAGHTGVCNENHFEFRHCHSERDHVDSVDTLNKKLMWATGELAKTASVEYSIQLCNLIQSCASAIRALKDL